MLVKQAQADYRAGGLYWPADLMVELERQRRGRSLDWGIACVKALIENAPQSGNERLMRWLSELSSARHAPVVAEVREASLRIWHEERDLVHTAISHLYAALVHLAENDDRSYRRAIIDALCVMGDHPFFRETSAAIPLALFTQFTEMPELGALTAFQEVPAAVT